MANKSAITEGLKLSESIDGRSGNDTIKLWESHREQAMLWRALALLQIPSTSLAILAALVMYFFADTIIQVPQKPQPGYYSVKELPDSAFINVAHEVVNLLATYQPERVELQYSLAKKYLWEPALSKVQEIMNGELLAIKQTQRSVLFMIVPSLTRVQRDDANSKVVVILRGSRYKIINMNALPPEDATWEVQMTTIPRNVSNEYGIVVTGLVLKTGKNTDKI